MTETPVLYGYFRSSAAFRVRIALNMKAVAYHDVARHLRKGEQRTGDYLSINPQGLVPALAIDGHLLTQSLSIIEYLDELHPDPALLPVDLAGRARVRAMAQLIACDIHPINNLRVLAYLRSDLAQPEDAVRRWYAHWVHEGFTALETMLANGEATGEYCHGNDPTLADVCLVPQVANAINFDIDLTSYPRIVEICERARLLPPFIKALPSNQPDSE